MEDKRNLAFGKINFILLAVGMLIVLVGFILLGGEKSTAEVFNPAIFDTRHVKVAPVVTFIGFISIIVAIMWKPKDNDKAADTKLKLDADTKLKLDKEKKA